MGALNVQRTLAQAKQLEKSCELRTARPLPQCSLQISNKNPRAKSALTQPENRYPNLSHPPKGLQQQILAPLHSNKFTDLSQILSVAVAEYPTSAFLWNLTGMSTKASGEMSTAKIACRSNQIL
ncbi:hypothetical protein SAMN06265373_102326 [Shimia sagamensis]|uniref:Uncharacterized protein n=1 Tax=Shimia sagamensis TaxID=1566352 RepID=A0ABY1NKM0_9RHOB|nr:hypothetical protein SAMN06265373_102326 [Shimia sagamensis]